MGFCPNPMGAPSIERARKVLRPRGVGKGEGRPICEGRVTARRCRNGSRVELRFRAHGRMVPLLSKLIFISIQMVSTDRRIDLFYL